MSQILPCLHSMDEQVIGLFFSTNIIQTQQKPSQLVAGVFVVFHSDIHQFTTQSFHHIRFCTALPIS
jgi:hypothetical protein